MNESLRNTEDKKKKICLESFLGIEDEEKRGNQIGEKSRVERMRR